MARMTAQGVLRRYAAGERNFCNVSLRGANFKGQDLSGADFSGADIRSVNFKDAKLIGTNFFSVKCGLQKRWLFIQFLVMTVLAILAGMIQVFVGAFAASLAKAATFEGYAVALSLLLFVIVCSCVLISQGVTTRTVQINTVLAILSFTIIAVVGNGSLPKGAFGGTIPFAELIGLAGTLACATAVSFAFALTGAFIFINLFVFVVAVIAEDLVTVALAVIVSMHFEYISISGVFASAVIFVSVSSLLSFFSAQQSLQGKENFLSVREFGLLLSTLGGTSFCGADLSKATFIQADFRNTSFSDSQRQSTNCMHVRWGKSTSLSYARLGSIILKDHRVCSLLITPEKGYKQDLTNANLRGANLTGITLEKAILRRAILSDALLEKTMLKDAILTEAQAVNADFTGACLTGATLESWNIDSTTMLKNIDCQYVFLREHPDARGNRERLPHDPDKVFQPGDFEKFFKEILDEVQILIRNGIDSAAFRAAFQNLMEQNPDITQDSIKSIEKQGADVLVTLEVPEQTDKAKVERDWDTGYQAGLEAGETRARLASGQKFEEIAFALAKKNISVESKSEVKLGDDYSRTITVQGDVNQSALVVGDNNQVSLQISQLDKTDAQRQLKDLLTQLQSAIEVEPSMGTEEKAEALAEVGEIAMAGKALQDGRMKRVAKRAISVLRGMTVGLGETTRFVEACDGLLPVISGLFGL